MAEILHWLGRIISLLIMDIFVCTCDSDCGFTNGDFGVVKLHEQQCFFFTTLL